MDSENPDRRSFLVVGAAGLAAAGYIVTQGTMPKSPQASKDQIAQNVPVASGTPLVQGGVVSRAAMLADLTVDIVSPAPMPVPMQTNGIVLYIETLVATTALDLGKIVLNVSDTGHDASGAQVAVARRVGVQSRLLGPYNQTVPLDAGPNALFLVLADQVYNQDATWRSVVESIEFLPDWMAGLPSETIPGTLVERNDSLAYPPFPVKTPTLPFQRLAEAPLNFEVTGMHQWGRDGRMFARVEAWANVAGIDGPIASSATMARSVETPDGATPSGVPAPVYTLAIQGGGLADGVGEIRYKVYPFVGPPWLSTERGEAYPTINAPKGLPICRDATGSWSPIHGVIASDGVGLPGTDLRGLSYTVAGAVASGLVYRDCAAVATAVRSLNASSTARQIADGLTQRTIRHDDIAGGVAVLRPVVGSVPESNFGSYAVRTGFSALPSGATCFEIRSESGLPSADVRMRGIAANGAVLPLATKGVPLRLLLRGVWLDGVGTVGVDNAVIDGTGTGQSLRPLSVNATVYLLSVDCVITESAAGGSYPVRMRPGYAWDVRLRHEGIRCAAAIGAAAAYSGLVASIGSSYSAPSSGLRFTLTTLLGVRLFNLAAGDRGKTVYPSPTGILLLNARIDHSTVFSSPMLFLSTSLPVVGGMGIGNVFARGAVRSTGPILQVGADGTLVECDNLIIRHFGHDIIGALSPLDGRVNLLYQDQGYLRINRCGSIAYSAFRSLNLKGDTFPATQKASDVAPAIGSWSSTSFYYKGAIAWDTVGVSGPQSNFYQAIANTLPPLGTPPAALSDASVWRFIGKVHGIAYGAQPLRQGNAAFRYHTGWHGNVACSTYNSVAPGPTSGYGLVCGRDEQVNANALMLYKNPSGDDYRPRSMAQGDANDSALLARVPLGGACLPFDLGGAPRLNDGSGAAGAYERQAAAAPI